MEIPLLVRLNYSKKVPKFNISNHTFRLSQFLLKTPPQIYLNNQTSISKFHKLKLETAAVGVNLHSLMVRFSFMRDCGSIPHGDSTVSTFFSIFQR